MPKQPISRRNVLTTSASLAGLATLNRLGLAQYGRPEVTFPAPDTSPVALPSTAIAKQLYADIGPDAWTQLIHRLNGTNKDLVTQGLRHVNGIQGLLLTGYPYNEYYDWDLYFENMYLSYYGVYPYCFTNLKEFLNRQQPDGYISRSLIKQRDRQHFKPFLTQLVVLGSRQNHDDYEWVRGNYYTRLSKYLDKWFSYDGDKNGLPVWNSCDAAGTDNEWSRAGALSSFTIEGVDLASYLVRELRAMAVIANALGIHADVVAYNKHADDLIKLINDNFWSEKEGMYFDRNEKTGQLVDVKSATSFAPLFAGAATPERAKRMIHEHMLNTSEFWLEYPVASYAKTEPDYYQGTHNECNWRGPTWAPNNYMIFQGLQAYGYHTEARELARRLFNMAVMKNPVLREYYNAETGGGLGQTRFWGFTALYYGMLLESYANYDASSLDKGFYPIIPKELGVNFPPLPADTPAASKA
jgi:putative isomerase